MKKCPECGGPATKIIYAGFPMKFCEADTTLWGIWSYIPTWFGYNGVMFIYTTSYLRGLWNWLTATFDDDDDGYT